MDPLLPQAVGAIFFILLLGFILSFFRQPHVVAYLIAGIVIGPWGFGLITDSESISRLGTAGVVLLLFFVGMETDIHKLVSNWKLIIFGTLMQIVLSVGCIWLLGLWFDWSIARIVLIGFVISLSSTAIVIKLLQDNSMLSSNLGQSVLGILLAQDLAIIPMLIIIGLLGAGNIDNVQLVKQSAGTILAIALFSFIFSRKQVHLPLSKWLKDDRELQLFAALGICFGLAMLTAWFELSTALGAFIAGMLVGVAKETLWVHRTLDSFRVLFVALFFVSIGMLLDISFLITHWLQATILVIAALITNVFINAVILKLSKYSWKESLYAGVLLSQIGEFSFILAAVGHQANIINGYGYQLALCVISLSLLTSPIWIGMSKKWLKFAHT
ncbi:cation:proton antiporter [Colwellia sp. MB02u-18]|uniref:cation:proton antiporter n=1 Tax=unclassified Colwellia TaxID=196834 RepID=UPI0015F68A33|nr:MULTISPECIES: cation:proton antiporter [unclassified Colwellia]MBA6224931.1 cation:proton antiporter [Colwellia sp. MB3u-45]MBA6268781.1 cation:proton antiporter [Colwellia sp. MB3u-43]MBA6321212.1 cation:proton antiporter [Colwellia sp. MB02u-19]MBA6325765.1 cation:proton antiporter [Colwellia sp. MB02u-18]MBA6332240.1 cation:proton antiporter [Colwellia sp. MB02u-12]